MVRSLRFTLSVVTTLCFVAFAAHAQEAFPGDPGSGAFPALQTMEQSQFDAPDEIVHTQWSALSSLPEAKEWNAVAYLDGIIYSFGGYIIVGNSLTPDASSYAYDIASDTWSPIKDFPVKTVVHSVAYGINGKIYILGGVEYSSTAGDYVGNSIVYEYDPAANTYALMSSMPTVQFFFGSGVIDNKIYVVGGRNATAYLSKVQVYDPIADTWDSNFDFPVKMMDLGCASVDGSLITVGGYNAGGNYRSAYKGTLDGNGNLIWTQIDTYPLSFIRYPCGAGMNGKAYFTGGYSVQENESATQFTYAYDLASSTWEIFEKKITGIQNSQIVSDGTFIYSAGGELAGRYATDAVEALDPTKEGPLGTSSSPDVLLITASTNDMVKRSKTVTLQSEGLKTVTWDAAVNGDYPWISFGTASGSIEGYRSAEIEVFVDPATMPAGENVGSVNINTNDPLNPTYTIEVRGYKSSGDVVAEKTVLVEEFSGTWCGWCPDGVDTLKVLEAQFGEKIAVITYHQGANDPMVTSRGLSIIGYLGVTGYPTASIDRKIWPGNAVIPISRNIWGSSIRSVLENDQSIVNIEFKNKTLDEVTRRITMTVEVTFLQATQGDFRLMFVQTTNQRNFAQTDYTPSTHTAFPYFHDHVASAIYPDERGFVLGDGSIIMPGTKFTQDLTFTSVDSLPTLSDFTAFVYNRLETSSGPVLQAHFEPMLNNIVSVQPVDLAGSFALDQNFPNPFNPSTTIRYNVPHTAQVKLVVTDVLGRTVATLADGVQTEGLHTSIFDASGLQSGTYFVTMTSGSFIETMSITLMK